MSATDADRLKAAAAWEKAMNAPAVRTVNPPAPVGPSANAHAWLRAIDPNRSTTNDDAMGTRAAATSWARGMEVASTDAEIEMNEAQRRHAAKDDRDFAAGTEGAEN